MMHIEQVRGWFVVGALGLGVMATGTSCLRVNDEHCMFNGGNDACSGRFCVAAVEDGSDALATVGADGCSDEEPSMDPSELVAYVKYGLVDDEEELLQLLRREGVSDTCDDMSNVELLVGVESDLRSGGRARRAAAALTVTQRDSIHDLNRAIDQRIAECGEDQTIGSTTMVDETTVGETDPTSSSTTSPECMVETEDVDCPDVAMPFCGPEGECVACSGTEDPDAACMRLDVVPATPICLGDVCVVQCTAEAPEACAGSTPVCDDATNICVPCTAHDQCGEAACNLFTGACLPVDAVVHVGPGQNFATLGAAVNSFGAGAEGTIIVHSNEYNESVTIDGGRVLAFLAVEIGAGVQPPRWIRISGSSPQLTVGDATVLMDGMQLSSNASTIPPGLLVNGGRAWLDRSRIVTNSGGGLVAQNAAELVLRNCFVGGDVNDRNALDVNDATASIAYTTLAAGFGAATALSCDAQSTTTVRNSLIVSRSAEDEVMCTGATIEHSAAELDVEGTNTALGAMNTNWFTSYVTGDFHLTLMHPSAIDTAAQWQAGDPPTDIDGNLRPTEDGASDHAGADVP